MVVPIALDAAVDGDRRIELALVDLDLQLRSVGSMKCGLNRGMFVQADSDRFGQASRQKRFDAARRLQLHRLHADHLPIDGDAVFQIGLRGEIVGARGRKAGLGLSDVSARDLADIEPIARLAELFLKNDDVVLARSRMAVSRSTFI